VRSDHDGRTAIVTGGSRGIGREVARELVAAGARVLITGRKRPALEAAAASLGPACLWQVCHAAAAAAAEECVAYAMEAFGRIDYLVNNAGTNPQWGPTIDLAAPLATKLTEVNQWAPLLWTQLVWRAGMRENGGAVVNVTSIGAIMTSGFYSDYCATKHALDALSLGMDIELQQFGIRVATVVPGGFTTSMASNLIDTQRPDSIYPRYATTLEEYKVRASGKEDLSPVTDAIIAAATDPEPRARYLVGTGSAEMLRTIVDEGEQVHAFLRAREAG